MHTKFLIGIMIAATFLGISVTAGASVDFEEGQWEITSQVKMQGMNMPAQTFSQCITKDNMVPQNNTSGQQGGSCTVSDVKTSGNTVSWSVVCKTQGGEMKGKGKITYQGDRFTGDSIVEMMGMEMVTEMSGRRTGACQ